MGLQGFLDPAIQRRIDRLGYATADIFSAAELEGLRRAYLPPEHGLGKAFHASMYSVDRAYRRRVFDSLAPCLSARLADILSGYRVRLVNWVVKEPGEGDSTVHPHQDWSFVDERSHRSVHVWIPLDDVDQRNGCLEVVGGSHRISTDHRSHGDPCRFQELVPVFRDSYCVALPLGAGQGLFYDGALLHWSGPNRSGRRRVALGAVLVPSGVPIIHAYRISPAMVEVYGVDDAFFWRHVPGERPTDAAWLGEWESSCAQHGSEVLRMLPPPEAAGSAAP